KAIVVERDIARVDVATGNAVAVRVGNPGVEVVVDHAARTCDDDCRQAHERVRRVVGDPAPGRGARTTRTRQALVRAGRLQMTRNEELARVIVVIEDAGIAGDV